MKKSTLKRKTPLRPKKPMERKKKPSVDQMERDGVVFRASSLPSPKKKMRPRAKKKPGVISQIDVFWKIWRDRPHFSEVSGLPLVDPPEDGDDEAGMRAWVSQFSHVLPKGTYRGLKHSEDNIILKTIHEHEMWETRKSDLRGRLEWEWVFELERSLKAKANKRKSYQQFDQG